MERVQSEEALHKGRTQAPDPRRLPRSKSAELQPAPTASRRATAPAPAKEAAWGVRELASLVLPAPEGEVVFESRPSKSHADFPLPESGGEAAPSAATSELEAKLRLRMLKCEGRDALYRPSRASRSKDHSPTRVPARLKQRALMTSSEMKDSAKVDELLVTASYQRCTKARARSAHRVSRHKKKEPQPGAFPRRTQLGSRAGQVGQMSHPFDPSELPDKLRAAFEARAREAEHLPAKKREWSARGRSSASVARQDGGAPGADEVPKATAKAKLALETKESAAAVLTELTESAPESVESQEQLPSCKTFALDDPAMDCQAVVEEEISVDELLLDLVNHLPAHLAKKLGLVLQSLSDPKQGGRTTDEGSRHSKAQQRTPRDHKEQRTPRDHKEQHGSELQREAERFAAKAERLRGRVAALRSRDLEVREERRAAATELQALQESIVARQQQQSGVEEALEASELQMGRALGELAASEAELQEARRQEEDLGLKAQRWQQERERLRRAAASAEVVQALQEQRFKIAAEEETARSEFEQRKSELKGRIGRFEMRLEAESSERAREATEAAETRASARCLKAEYLAEKTEVAELRRRAAAAELARQQREERLREVSAELRRGAARREELVLELSAERELAGDHTSKGGELQAKQRLAARIQERSAAAARHLFMADRFRGVAESARRSVQAAKAKLRIQVPSHEPDTDDACRAAERLSEIERQGEELQKEVEALDAKVAFATKQVRCKELRHADGRGQIRDACREPASPGASASTPPRGAHQPQLAPACYAWQRARRLAAAEEANLCPRPQPEHGAMFSRPPSSRQDKVSGQRWKMQRAARTSWDLAVMREELQTRRTLGGGLHQSRRCPQPSALCKDLPHQGLGQRSIPNAPQESILTVMRASPCLSGEAPASVQAPPMCRA
mmetsp:Transcript_125705/g.367265  ORF Transcript_125705/g.367265 Transcript_125705/m.367265 type:complete len:918 (-) Transcript_125705:8-2761(-)